MKPNQVVLEAEAEHLSKVGMMLMSNAIIKARGLYGDKVKHFGIDFHFTRISPDLFRPSVEVTMQYKGDEYDKTIYAEGETFVEAFAELAREVEKHVDA